MTDDERSQYLLTKNATASSDQAAVFRNKTLAENRITDETLNELIADARKIHSTGHRTKWYRVNPAIREIIRLDDIAAKDAARLTPKTMPVEQAFLPANEIECQTNDTQAIYTGYSWSTDDRRKLIEHTGKLVFGPRSEAHLFAPDQANIIASRYDAEVVGRDLRCPVKRRRKDLPSEYAHIASLPHHH